MFCVRRLGGAPGARDAMRSCALPARSAHTPDASGRTRSSAHFREVTPRDQPPLTERPSLLDTLPVWPILRLPHRHGPLCSDYVSREPQQGRQRVSKASHARDVSFLSLSPRCRRRVPGVPSFDLATVLPLHPNRRTHPLRTRLRDSLLAHVHSGPGFYWLVRCPDQLELALSSRRYRRSVCRPGNSLCTALAVPKATL